jgi:hypothetical protein
MIRPEPEIVQMMARISAHYPEFAKWLNDWRMHELERLPDIAPGIVGTAQGRCQVLTELCKLVNSSRDLSAQSRKR